MAAVPGGCCTFERTVLFEISHEPTAPDAMEYVCATPMAPNGLEEGTSNKKSLPEITTMCLKLASAKSTDTLWRVLSLKMNRSGRPLTELMKQGEVPRHAK